MIPSNELSEGNYVVHSQQILKIAELIPIEKTSYDPDGTQADLLHPNGNRYDESASRSTGDLLPLPIQRLHLMKLRFDSMQDDYLLNGFMVSFRENDTKVSFIYGDTKVEDVKGFHQLQNHYTAFTGKELPDIFKEN